MDRASRNSGATGAATRGPKPALPPSLPCDLCSYSVPTDQLTRAKDGAILGLIVCSQCVEDALEARQLETAA
jgi:hypothetical protein